MICPRCGTDNPENATLCSNCRYKFRNAEGQRDPAQSGFFFAASPKGKSRKNRFMGIFFAILFLLILLLIIISSLRAV